MKELDDKTVSYIALALSIIVVLMEFFFNSKPLRYGLFATEIRYTFIYDLSRDIVSDNEVAYFIWFALLGGSLYYAWRLRDVVAVFIRKVHNKI